MEKKLPSRIEDRWGQLGPPHVKRFWAQKAATRGPQINQTSMKNRCENQWEIRMGFYMASGACLIDYGGKMSVSCKRGAHFQNFDFFMLGLTFL